MCPVVGAVDGILSFKEQQREEKHGEGYHRPNILGFVCSFVHLFVRLFVCFYLKDLILLEMKPWTDESLMSMSL